jgi:uncharacterized membrane protein YbaN (DUF454 family)
MKPGKAAMSRTAKTILRERAKYALGCAVFLWRIPGWEEMRFIYISIGVVAVALGVLGIALPLLPTTPFLLVAAWAFAKSSPRLEHWLVNHARFGPPIEAWRARGAIPTRVKIVALVTMCLSLLYILIFSSLPVVAKVGSGLILAACATFISTRPAA